jgi:DNA polymerase-3 subunit delta
MQDIINELRKLIEYAGENGIITKETIDMLCIKKIDSVIFDLTDNLGKKNIKQALVVLNNLIYTKEPIQKILITLYNHFKKLYLVKLAVKWNNRIDEAINLKPNQTFLVSKYKTQANYFKEEELRAILEELINLDANYKTGLIDINIGLESILCKYCSN